jgi:hypothetical protein
LSLSAISLMIFAGPVAVAEEGWTNLIQGNSLDGWEVKSGVATYKLEDGCVVGTTVEGSPNTFLCTKKEYGDFILEFEVLVDTKLNSGVQVRSHAYEKEIQQEVVSDGKKRTRTWPAGRVYGYQVEICDGGRGKAGGIYDEARRGWIDEIPDGAPAGKAFKNDQWNQYRVECRGDSIKTWINGIPCADLKDSMDAKGFIGLQVHGIGKEIGPFQVRWRNLRIKELD